MYLEKNMPFNFSPPSEGIIFEEVKTRNDLIDWLWIINEEIQDGFELELDSFKNLLNDSAFRFFRLVRGKKTLSALLTFKSGDTTGIYMVSTVSGERQKGLGKWIISSVIDTHIESGCNEFVLQATEQGYKVYKSLGFTDCNEYGIFLLTQ